MNAGPASSIYSGTSVPPAIFFSVAEILPLAVFAAGEVGAGRQATVNCCRLLLIHATAAS
jgi:hypothetical protein